MRVRGRHTGWRWACGTESRPIAEDAATQTVCMGAAEVLRGQGIEGFGSNAGLEQEISEGGVDVSRA